MNCKVVLFSFLTFFATQVASAAVRESIRIMTYNIPMGNIKQEEGNGQNTWENRALAIHRYFARIQPDLIGMQEPVRASLCDMLRGMPNYAMVGTGRDNGADNGEFTPILYKTTRFRVLAYDTYWLTNTPKVHSRVDGSTHYRIATWAFFEDKQTGARFLYTNTHLSYDSPTVKDAQLRVMKPTMKELQDKYGANLPHYMTGDFNMKDYENADSTESAACQGSNYNLCLNLGVAMKDMWIQATRKSHYSKGAAYPPNRIDYIFASPSVSCSYAQWDNRKDGDGYIMSDHDAIWADTYFNTTTIDDARAAINAAWAAIDKTQKVGKTTTNLITLSSQLSTDGYDSSYPLGNVLDGSNSTYFQSLTSGTAAHMPHYIQVELLKDVTNCRISYIRRSGSDGINDRMQDVMVTASNDGSTWDYITELYDFGGTDMGAYMSENISLHKPYKYLRFNVMHTPNETLRNGNPQFSCSEFQVLENTVQADSPRLANNEVKAAADNLETLIATTQARIDAENVTASDVTTLQNATQALIDAYHNDYPEVTVYEIGTPQQLIDFAARVNAGENNINGFLTADIDLSGKEFTAIGSANYMYTGTFDGRGYKISNLNINNNQSKQGLFGTAGGGAVIRNLTLEATCSITCATIGAGFVGSTHGPGTLTIENCGNEATITGNKNCGGFVGGNFNDSGNGRAYMVNIINCYNKGRINANLESAGIAGWLGNDCNLQNCYNIGEVTGLDGTKTFARVGGSNATFDNCYETIGNQVTQVTPSQVSGGELCYLLNGSSSFNPIWTQTLSSANSFPVPNESQEVVYNDNGLYVNLNDIVFLDIATAEELIDFADRVNAGETTLNGRLTADIDLAGKGDSWAPIGSTMRYQGMFDGQGHTISNMVLNQPNKSDFGLFKTGANVTLKNFILDPTCSITGAQKVGIVGNHSGANALFQNIGNMGPVNGEGENVGGLLGGAWAGSATVTIDKCWVVGDITTRGPTNPANCAAFSGWSNSGTFVFNDCWTTAHVPNSSNESAYLARYGSTVVFNNCYSLYGTQVDQIESVNPESIVNAISNGELAYKLNGDQKEIKWYQTLGEDATPVPFSSHKIVYKIDDTYSNDQGGNGQTYQTGDVDEDGTVDITDAVAIINVYLTGNTEGINESMADVNGDGVIDITDAVEVINIYLKNN